jgi:hypothetical protein
MSANLKMVSCNPSKTMKGQQCASINSVVGEQSFREAFHRWPTIADNDYTRIVNHLSYIHHYLCQQTTHFAACPQKYR